MIKPSNRLAFFLPDLAGAGAQRVTLNLAQGVAERGYGVDLVLAQAKGAYLSKVSQPVRLVDLKASRGVTSLPALARYMRRERPQAVLSAIHYTNIIALWARRLARVSTRVVVSEHSVLSYSAQSMISQRERLIPRFIGYFYPWADGIIAVSRGAGDALAQMTAIPREVIQVVYNPVVMPDLPEKVQAPIEHPWFGPGEPPVVLAVGRLAAVKDFSTLIQAFARVRQVRPARLLILGEGEERSTLEQLVRQLGLEQEVSLAGFVENPYAYMARASLFVLSSRYEALPTVLIEALYCGVPIIATDCAGGTREILKDGQYGQLVPVGDAPALAQAIEISLAGKKAGWPQESWQSFEMDTVVDQYLTILLGKQ